MSATIIQFKKRFEFIEPVEPITPETFRSIYISFNEQVQPVLIIESTAGQHKTVIGDRGEGAFEQWFADSSVVLAIRDYLVKQGLHDRDDWTCFDKVTHFKNGDRLDTRLTCLKAFCSFVNFRLHMIKYTAAHGHRFNFKTISRVLYKRRSTLLKYLKDSDIDGLLSFKMKITADYPDYYVAYNDAVAANSLLSERR